MAHLFCFTELYNVTILFPSGQRSDIWIGHSDSKVQKETLTGEAGDAANRQGGKCVTPRAVSVSGAGDEAQGLARGRHFTTWASS